MIVGWVVVGAGVLGALAVAALVAMAGELGWATTIRVWAFAVAVTLVVTAGELALSYGIEGHW